MANEFSGSKLPNHFTNLVYQSSISGANSSINHSLTTAVGSWVEMNGQILHDFSEDFSNIIDKFGYGDMGFDFLLFGALIAVPTMWLGMRNKSHTYTDYKAPRDFDDTSMIGQYKINKSGALELPSEESQLKKAIR